MKQLSASERTTLAIVAIAVLAGGIAPTVAPDALGTALFYDAAVLAATTFGLAGLLRLPADRRADWWFVPLAGALFFAGDAIRHIYDFGLDRPAPLPSIADLFYLSAYPLMLVVIIRLLRSRTDVDVFNTVLDVATLAMAVGLLVWEPLLAGEGRSLQGAIVAGLYPVSGAALIGFAGVLVGARRGSQASLLLLGGAGVMFIADLTHLILENAGRYSDGGWPDPLFVIGPFLFAAAPWFDTTDDPTDLTLRRRPRPVASTVVVVASLVALPIDFGLAGETEGTAEPVVHLLLRVLLLALVAARLLRQATANAELVANLETTSTRLSTVIENTTDAVLFTTPDAVVLEWNTAAEKLFGYPREAVVGRNILDFFVRPENAQTVRDVLAAMHGGGVHEFNLTLEPYGSPIAVALQVGSVLDPQGHHIGFVTVARDDTRDVISRRAMESFTHLEPRAALTQFAHELRAFVAFDVLSLASIEDGDFRELARVVSRGDNWNRELTPVDPEYLIQGPLEEYGAGAITDRPFVILRTADFGIHGDQMRDAGIVESIGLPLRDPLTDEVRGVIGVGFSKPGAASASQAEALARVAPEVSQSVHNMILFERERRTAERLQELDDLREGFFAMVAHEIRSPLGAIGTAASVLRDQGARMDASEAQELAAGISSGARRLARLTGDLLDAGRGGQGTFPCEMKPIKDFGAIVERATAAATGVVDRVLVRADRNVRLIGDADRLAQVVTNLVTNALKFSGEGPVEVDMFVDRDAAVLQVVDHGPGIPLDQAHRLFQRFVRLRVDGPGPRPSGTGLGLYITQQLVVAHMGSIKFLPTRGGGATFEVRLPCYA